jgi:epoxyqueuosine reductase
MVSLADAAEARLSDDSPIVRAMAVWALAKLVGAGEFAALAERYADHETDQDVAHEWRN